MTETQAVERETPQEHREADEANLPQEPDVPLIGACVPTTGNPPDEIRNQPEEEGSAVTSFPNETHQKPDSEGDTRTREPKLETDRPPSYTEVEYPLPDGPPSAGVQIAAESPNRRRCFTRLACERSIVFVISFVTMLILYIALCGLQDRLAPKKLKDLFAHMFSFTILYVALGVVYK